MRILTHAERLDAIRTYAMLAAERMMPLSIGERVRRPVLRTIRRNNIKMENAA